MRERIELQNAWYVSVSPRDAALAASGSPYTVDALELASDPANHPQCIDLPGGPSLGLRPAGANGQRLPAPFLSYARRLALPATTAGDRVLLTLDKVRYHVTLHINGLEVTHYRGGWEPHHFDITSFVTPGQDALLLITVGDTGVSGHRTFDAYNYTGTRLPTCEEIKDNLIHPVAYGGADRAVGVVTIDIVPPLRIDWVFANPSVARGELAYRVHLSNDSDANRDVRLACTATGADGRAVPLLQRSVQLAPHASQIVEATIAWPDAVLWDTDNPHLYDLENQLFADEGEGEGNGRQLLDTQRDYFGFREFTIDGPDYYLNGKKIHLLGSSGHITAHQDAMSLDDKIAFFKQWQEIGNVNHVRLHARPKDKRWVQAADRTGMLITTESALWTTGFTSFDWAGSEEACYVNVRDHILEGLVRRDRNNPSVIMWSFSNEMSPITPYDLQNPKMAAMTRSFEKIIAEAEAEDPSRVIQMSSAMDFIGKLKMINLHYPKSWQAFPDYPHTAYWLDGSFLFPWYGSGRPFMPSWSWRRDKPLYIGEFTCVYGPTPDSQACIVGDIAFEDADAGTNRVGQKLWPMEINAYRRQGVSGFCAWVAMFAADYEVPQHLQLPHIAAHSYALRPLAVLNHSYRTNYYEDAEIAIELSVHNDSRYTQELALSCTAQCDGEVFFTETMPAAGYGPGDSLAFTSRLRAPHTTVGCQVHYSVSLTAGGKVVDSWTKTFSIAPRADTNLAPQCAFYDPEGNLAALCARAGVQGAAFITDLAALQQWLQAGGPATLWLNFAEAKLRLDDWQALQPLLLPWVRRGGHLVIDKPTDAICAELPVPLHNAKGYAADERLEITTAYNIAPHHAALAGFAEGDFALWGEDHYLAHRCFETPQGGNATPLLVVGADLGGLTFTPLIELRSGAGVVTVSSLELFAKLHEEPVVSRLLQALCAPRAPQSQRQAAVCVGSDTLAALREVGLRGENQGWQQALTQPAALLDAAAVGAEAWPTLLAALPAALERGSTVYLHDLSEDATRQLLHELDLPGEVAPGAAPNGEFDVVRHNSPLADGLTNNYLYWTVDKARLAAWSAARLHPEPAGALICNAEAAREGSNSGSGAGAQALVQAQALTRRGAVTVYKTGGGTLLVDNLRWQLPNFDEPQRPRRYLMTLLTNLDIELAPAAIGSSAHEFESEAERRERGHF